MIIKKISLIFFVILGSYFLSGKLIELVSSNAILSNRWVNHRFKLAMEFMQKADGDKVLVIGPSEVESGFNPQLFNQLLKKSNSNFQALNLGFRNMSPSVLEALINQIQFSKLQNLKLDAIYIKLGPSDLTDKSKYFFDNFDWESKANIYSFDYLLSNFNFSNFLIFCIKKFQGGYVSSNLEKSLKSIYLKAVDHYFSKNYLNRKEEDSPRFKFWMSPQYNLEPAWDSEQLGFHNRDNSETHSEIEELYLIQQRKEMLDFNFKVHERFYGVSSLNFDLKQVEKFEIQLKRLSSLTENVVLFYFNDHPDIIRSTDTQQRLAQLLDRFCAIDKVRCLRFDKLNSFKASDYYDAFHLVPGAVNRLSELLAQDFLIMQNKTK